ncbi:hypothetical protein HJC23_007965 [Cyclotella cryptica]|uniref:Uncharacterized protein n=1 Tax=Cyclotella cryptica TaxID=29204 RepID=A0ABD3P5X4_9STRA|eukprot:CCRYP_017336-RA/>CCRYP_017336-RA protein AED:0.12 eAED:0.13 QI:0/-1/0/1/-1/1/1/0/633
MKQLHRISCHIKIAAHRVCPHRPPPPTISTPQQRPPTSLRPFSTEILRPGQKITIDPSSSSSSHRKKRPPKSKPIHSSPPPFIDRIHIRTRAGSGGKGCISYHHIGSYKRRPSGGHGGKGGNVYLVTDPTVGSLKMEKHHFHAMDGGRGGTNGRQGKDGRDVFVRVPCGVVVRRVLDWEEMDLFDGGEDQEEEHWDELEEEDEEDDEDEDEDDEDFIDEAGLVVYPDNSDSDNEQHLQDDLDMVSDDSIIDEEQHTHDDEDGNNIEDEFEDFDTYYQQLKASKRYRGRGRRRHQLPIDYDEVVNQELRGEDGMYHWNTAETDDVTDEMALTENTYESSGAKRKSVFVADLDQPHVSLLVAQGGKPGVGNQAYANRQHTAHLMAHAAKKSKPEDGECTYLELELKLIADVGLVGFPNAGKSSLLSAMSRARPKIASYPFTTLHPLVGTIHYKDGYKIVMADVPGLIDGAAEGRGRGVEFLRHIERTKALVYIVDAAGVDGRDAVNDLRILGKELREYGSSGYFEENEIDFPDGLEVSFEEEMKRRRREIMNRPSLILANKMDLIPKNEVGLGRREELLFHLGNAAEEVGINCEKDNIMGISAGVTGEGLQVLSKQLRNVLSFHECRQLALGSGS